MAGTNSTPSSVLLAVSPQMSKTDRLHSVSAAALATNLLWSLVASAALADAALLPVVQTIAFALGVADHA